jgi:hypothetical protein
VLWVTLALTAAALIAGGMGVGRPVLRSGLRQLAFGALALAVTYLVGHLIGSSHAWRQREGRRPARAPDAQEKAAARLMRAMTSMMTARRG